MNQITSDVEIKFGVVWVEPGFLKIYIFLFILMRCTQKDQNMAYGGNGS